MRSLLVLLLCQVVLGNPLWNALQANRMDLAKALLRNGHGVDSLEGDRSAPLSQAVSANHLAAVRFLVANGAKIDGISQSDRTPLMIACEKGHLDIATYLISAGANWNVALDGESPLILAVKNSHANLVLMLLEKGADPNVEPPTPPDSSSHRSALFESIHTSDTTMFQRLFQRSPESNRQLRDGTTLLMEAAKSNQIKHVRHLLNLDARVNQTNLHGESALLLACDKRADSAVLKLLLSKGADPNLPDSNGRTPLMAATYAESAWNVRILLRWKADVNALDRSRESAISKALDKRSTAIAGLLIQAGANLEWDSRRANRFLLDALQSTAETMELILPAIKDVDIKIYGGEPKDSVYYQRILSRAAISDWPRVASLALSKGADPMLRNYESLTPLELAYKWRRHDVFATILRHQPSLDSTSARKYLLWYVERDDSSNALSLLVKKGGRVDFRSDKGQTPLMIAAQHGQNFNMGVLLKSKADLSLRDVQGKSALHHSIAAKCKGCVDLLLENGASLKIQDKDRVTPVTQAILASDTILARLAISKGGKCIDASPLYPFAFGSDASPEMSIYVLNHCRGIDLGLALLTAAGSGNVSQVEELIKRKANVNARDELGRTPLMVNTFGKGREAIHDLLVSHGAKMQLRDKNGNTAADYYTEPEGD